MVAIYADIVFLVNFIMNFTIFWIVTKLAKRKIKFYRILLGAVVAAFLYSLFIFVPTARGFYNFFTAVLIVTVALFVVFGRTDYKKFLLYMAYAHGVAFMIGGMTMAINNYINTGAFRHFSFGLLAISILLSYVGLKLAHLCIQKITLAKQMFYTIKIFKGEDIVQIRTLVDTGNSLIEPISGIPVVIAQEDYIKKLAIKEEDLRVIPYKTVGKKGILMGFKPDKIEILELKETKEVMIAVYDGLLSKKGEYQGLLNPTILS